MKYLLRFFFLLFASAAMAQTTAITATITDSDATAWAGGTWTAVLVSPGGPPLIGGVPVTPTSFSGVMDGTGTFTATIADNSRINPFGSYWNFTLCPNASAICSQVRVSVSGASQNISAPLSAGVTAPRFSASFGAHGYIDGEVSPTPPPGGTYYNVSTLLFRQWTGSAWVTVGSGAGGAVASVANSDSTLTISPTTGAVIASLNLTHPNTWTGLQTLTGTNITGLPLSTGVIGLLSISNGGTGTASPALVPGSNITITGTWPNQTINSTATGTGNTTSTAGTNNTLAKFNGANSIINSAWTDDGVTTTYHGTGPGCISVSTNQICITAPPYNASTAGLTTTTTSGTFAVGTSGTVVSCSTLLANQGVLITGAGAAGANYVGTIVSCTGITLTVTPATSTSVANGTVVQHDETAAFLAAFTAIAGNATKTGTIFAPDGFYLVNGPLLDTGGSNAILPMPVQPNYTAGTLTDISIKGFNLPSWDGNILAGAVIKTNATVGNLFGGFDSAAGGGFPPFTNVKLELERLQIQAPCNTGAVMVNASHILALQARHVLINTTCGGAIPTATTGGAIFMPMVGNEVQLELDDIEAGGYWTVYRLTEHSHVGSIFATSGVNCVQFDNGTTSAGTFVGNAASIDYLFAQTCTNAIAGPAANPMTINIAVADLETNTTKEISDPNNLLYGIINFNLPQGNAVPINCTPRVTGGINLTLHALQCQPEIVTKAGPTLNIIPNGSNNGTIVFGNNVFGLDAIDLYASGSNKIGMGILAGEFQFFVLDHSVSHFSFNGNSGGLQPTGTNEFARLTPLTSGGGWTVASGEGYCFSNSTTSSVTPDTCVWRNSAGFMSLGSGTAGDSSGTFTSFGIIGPATAPSGSCTAGQNGTWVFSKDGHATFCNGTTWVVKI